MYQLPSALTLDNASQALEAGLRAIEAGQTEFDLSPLTTVDSSAVAALIAWKRAAAARGAALVCHGLPANLKSLADLYGVADLLHRH